MKTFIGPAILISLGVVFLLNNFGILAWDVWLSLWKFWPIILILIGVEIWMGKNASVKTFAILLGLIFFVPIFLSYNPLTNNPLATDEIKIEESLGTAVKAKINMNFPTSNITINSLEKDSSFLVEGKIVYSEASKKPTVEKESDLGVVILNISQAIEGKLPFISNLRTSTQLSLSNLVPIELFIKTSASTSNLDLSNLRIEFLEINSGASTISIKFAEDFNQKVLIRTGASTIKLEIPEKLGARVTIDSQIKSVDASDRFEKDGNKYQTKEFDKSLNKVEIEIKATAGSVIIK